MPWTEKQRKFLFANKIPHKHNELIKEKKIPVFVPLPNGKVAHIGNARKENVKKMGNAFFKFPNKITIKEAKKILKKKGY